MAKVQDLYDNSMFFKTLLENSMMSMAKSFFLLAYMKKILNLENFANYDEF
jgi:phosphoenolpyruvate carboxylase